MMIDPLGSQQSQLNDGEEQQHFQHVIQSYQQYATFHQTRQRGVNSRLENLLRGEKSSSRTVPSSFRGGAAGVAEATQAEANSHHPTLLSILPPSLLIQPFGNTSNTAVPEECLTYQKEFSAAAIRNQFFLDNILKYSHQETSQDVLRRWRQQQHGCSSCTHDDDNRTSENFSCNIEWTTEDRISKIDSVLKSVARDWSSEGHGERSVVYDRMITALQRHLPLSNCRTTDDDDDNNECEKEVVDIDDSRASTRKSTLTTPTPTIAVPGSGLGRLAWEIYSRGYSVQGSDFSLPMLLASDFILNGCGGSSGEAAGRRDSFQQFRISPWLAETKNVLSFQNRTRTIIVPDVDPTAIGHSNTDDGRELPEFTMLAGEFLHLYCHHLPDCGGTCDDGCNLHQHPSSHHHHHHRLPVSTKKFNAVVCSFFLDTAPSLPHYLLTIYHMLKDGGLFIHCGPLMYHWSGHGGLLPGDDGIGLSSNDVCSGGKNGSAYRERNKHLDSRYLTSIDYTWEEVRYMIVHCGFELLEEELQIPAHYTLDGRSMMKVGYDCVFAVARKKVANR